MINPTQFIYRVAMRCLGESQEIQSIIIDEELDVVRSHIHSRLNKLEHRIWLAEEQAQAPDYQEPSDEWTNGAGHVHGGSRTYEAHDE